MSKKISDVYNENPAAGDDTSMVSYFPAEAADGTPVAYSDEQLMVLAQTRLGVADLQAQIDFLTDAIADIPWQPPTEASGQFTATINENSLNVLVTGSINFDSDRYVAMTDDSSTPTGAVGAVYAWPADTLKSFSITLANWSPVVLRIWARRTVDSVWIMLDPNPSNGETPAGLEIIPLATALPIKPTFTAVVNSSYPETRVDWTIGASSVPDGALLTISLYEQSLGLLEVYDDAWTGTATGDTILSLYPDIDYVFYATVHVTGQISRVVTTDPVSVTTDSVGTISAFSINDYNGDTPYTTTIHEFTLDATAIAYGHDQYIIQIGNSSVPAVDAAGWADLPITPDTTTLTFDSLGVFDVYIWSRKEAEPTSYTPVASDPSVSITYTTGGTTDVQFANAVRVQSEDDPDDLVFTLTLTRNGDVSGSSTVRVYSSDGDATFGGIDLGPVTGLTAGHEGVHYRSIDKQVVFAASATTATVDVPVVFAGLGRSAADFYINLAVVSGCTLGTNSQQHWFITGSVQRTGLWPNGVGSYGYKQAVSPTTGLRDIDVYDPPTDLTPLTGQQNIADGTTYYSHKIINGNGANKILNLWKVRSAPLVIENCVIHTGGCGVYAYQCKDITVRNNYVYNIALQDGSSGGRGVAFFSTSWKDPLVSPIPADEYCRNMKSLGNRVEFCIGVQKGLDSHVLDGEGGIHCMNNYFKSPRASNDTSVTSNLFQYAGRPTQIGNCKVEGNNVYCDGSSDGMVDRLTKCVEDGINLYIGGLVSDNLTVYDNWLVGHNYLGWQNGDDTSGLGILLADGLNTFQQYYHVRGNHVSSWANGGINAYNCQDTIIEENFTYNANPDISPYWEDWDPGTNGVGFAGGSQYTAERNVTFRNNRTRYYKQLSVDDTVYLSNYWRPEYFDSTNQTVTAWDDPVVGNDRFRECKQAANQPAIEDGIRFNAFSSNFPVGPCTVTYNATADTLTVAPYGQSAGNPATFASLDYTNQSIWFVKTADESAWAQIRLTVPVASLPASSTVYTVQVTRFRHKDRAMYPGPTGYWTEGTGGGAPPSGDITPPEVPPEMSTLVDDSTTTIHGTCTQATDAGSGIAYYVWRVDQDSLTDKTSVGQTSPSFTVTEGVHSMQVAARDVAGNQTAFSAPMEVDTSGTVYDITNTEFTDTSGWTGWNANLTASGGIGNIANTQTSTGQLWQAFTIGASDTVVHYEWKLRPGTVDGAVNCIVSLVSSRPTYPGTMNGANNPVHYLSNMPTDGSWNEQSKTYTSSATNWPGAGTYYIQIWVNNTGVGKNLDIDYFRLWVT